MSDEKPKTEQKAPERKATDVLISVEHKIDGLMKVISSFDMTMKMVLDRLNRLSTAAPEPARIAPDKQPIKASPQEAIAKFEGAPQARKTSRPEMYDGKDNTANNEKKVPVIQRVSDQSGKDLFMANITIFDGGKELCRTKTNAAGKWQAYLPIGTYDVKISKTDSATKKQIEAMLQITVPDSNSTITLPPVAVKRN